ncbi:MAG: PEGA domain-containing protein [Planctomycetota bacterium]|nr:MAG: PEGA domain-containing protein [Planctomycetota bacterium]
MIRSCIATAAVIMLLFSPAAADDGKLLVSSNVKGKVYVNGIYMGNTGELLTGLPAGKAKLKVIAEGHEPYEKEITIGDGGLSKYEVELKALKGDSSEGAKETEPVGGGNSGAAEGLVKKQPAKPDDKKPDESSGDKKEETGPPTKDDVKTASKDKDSEQLIEILKNAKSEYKIKLMAASALLRLKKDEGEEAIESEVNGDFKKAPKAFIDVSPLFEGKKLIKTERLIMILKTKSAQFDSFEELVAGYVALCTLERRRQKKVADKEKAEDRFGKGWRGRRRGFRRANRQKNKMDNLNEDERKNHDCMKRITDFLKKAGRSKDKDLAALAKFLMKKADDRINPGS